MKNYDEITANVLQKAAVRTVKIRRIRYACTLTAVCTACVIGGAAFMKLDKPEFLPSESQTDTIHSASDPSTDITTETTATSTETTKRTTTAPQTTEPPTEITTSPVITTAAESQSAAEPATVYTVASASPFVNTVPASTYTLAPMQYTTRLHTNTTASKTTTVKATETSAAETTKPAETSAVQTTEASSADATDPAVTEQTAAETTVITSENAAETEVTMYNPETVPAKSLWDLLYDLYCNDQLPFRLDEETTTTETSTETTETTTTDSSSVSSKGSTAVSSTTTKTETVAKTSQP